MARLLQGVPAHLMAMIPWGRDWKAMPKILKRFFFLHMLVW